MNFYIAIVVQNLRWQPLVSYAVILNPIACTTTRTGLTVESYLYTAAYPAGVQVSAAEMAALHLERAPFHGEWNYTISPRTTGEEAVIH